MPIKSLEPDPLYVGVGFATADQLAPYNRFLALAIAGFIVSALLSLFLARHLSSRWIVEFMETALEETRASLQQSEQRYHALVSRLPSVVWSADREGKIILISPSVRRMFGFEVSEVVGQTTLHFDRVHPDDLMTVKAAYEALFNGESFDLMYRMQHKSGQWLWVEDHATCLESDRSAPVAYGVISNLSERRRLEHEMLLTHAEASSPS